MVKRETVQVRFLGRDQIDVEFELEAQAIKEIKITAISGCSGFEQAARGLMAQINRDQSWPTVWTGADHAAILLRELVLRAVGRFQLPYQESELCHCRAVPTEVVDRAIISGCHSIESVARITSAGTSCGTCKPDTEKLIAYRLNERLI
ncbi:MAG: (2Fe-2S)-binding protein [Bdellovibrionaceae bacterium]|nr:(2Fe-2S)-binding protein [Pseudobdellovibrionaceae bacterium]